MIRKIRKKNGSLGKFVGKIRKKVGSLGKLTRNIRKVRGETLKKRNKRGPHLILVGKLGKFNHIRKVYQAN